MGFIYAIPEKAYGILNDIWDDVVSGSSLSENPQDGTRFALGEKQMLLLLSEDKIVDYAVAPGGYIYHSAVEAGMDNADMEEKFPDSFVEKASENVTVQIMDLKQLSGGQFSFANVPFHDSEYDIDITIQGSGTFTLGIADPLFYYLKSKEQQETEKNGLVEQFVEALTPAIVEMGNVGIRYDQLPYVAGKMVTVINEQLGTTWKEVLRKLFKQGKRKLKLRQGRGHYAKRLQKLRGERKKPEERPRRHKESRKLAESQKKHSVWQVRQLIMLQICLAQDSVELGCVLVV